jgi:hypothetical protein
MTVSIKQHFKHLDNLNQIEFKRVMAAVLADSAALRAAIVGITAQLDTDGGVTETDYAASFDPAALTLVS